MRHSLASMVTVLILLAGSQALADATFRILAPTEESFIGMGEVLLIGRVDGFNEAKMVELTANGKTLGFVPLQNNTFIFKARLPEGRQEIVLTAPGVQRKAMRIFVGKQKGYRYHIETDTKECVTCHTQAAGHVYKVTEVEEDLCRKCHDPMGVKDIVHGPVAAGSCTPCHDPHGSVNDKFLVAVGKELCLVCHSQNLSRKHIEERQNADCVKCHDPHSSAKEYHLR